MAILSAEPGCVGTALRPLRINGLARELGAGFWERVKMRNALGLMLASVVTAVVVRALCFFPAPPRRERLPPMTVGAAQAGRLPATAPARPVPAREAVEVTAAI